MFKRKPHPIEKSTELPEYLIKRREWYIYGYYQDYLTIGHYINYFFSIGDFLIMNTHYGTIADSLIDRNRKIKCIDEHENEIETLTSAVREKFRVAHQLSDSIHLGLFDNIIGFNIPDFDNEEDLVKGIYFITRHSRENICINPKLTHFNYEDWIYIFKQLEFDFQISHTENFIANLEMKLLVVSLNNLMIFKRKEPIRAWSSEED